jgi:hypothetical protein
VSDEEPPVVVVRGGASAEEVLALRSALSVRRSGEDLRRWRTRRRAALRRVPEQGRGR